MRDDVAAPAPAPAPKLQRLRALVAGSLGIVAAIVAANIVLAALPGAWRGGGVADDPLEPAARLAVRARVEAAQALRATPGGASDALVLVAGLSTAREGIDPQAVARAHPERTRVLNIAGSGGSFVELLAYTEPVLGSRLDPAWVVIGVHASWLAGRDGQRRGSLPAVLEPVWMLAKRRDIHATAQRALLDGRVHVGTSFGVPLHALVPGGSSDPWDVQRRYEGARAPEDFLDTQLREWRAAGWFDPARYTTTGTEAAALAALLRRCRESSARTVLVLMPESAAFRQHTPPQAAAALLQAARAAHPQLALLDLRERWSDEHFYDHAHLNARGREALSSLLGTWLREQALAAQPSR